MILAYKVIADSQDEDLAHQEGGGQNIKTRSE